MHSTSQKYAIDISWTS